MLCMTRHKHAQTGLVTPSLPQLWLTAMLRVLAMLVSSVCSTLQMTRRPDRVNATRATPADLPRAKTDIQQQETHDAAQHRSPLALILRIAKRSSRRSEWRYAKRTNWSGGPIRAANAEATAKAGVLTTVSHTSPSPSVSLTTSAIHLPLLRMGRQAHSRNEGDVASIAEGGGGGLCALARKTEGAHRQPRTPLNPIPAANHLSQQSQSPTQNPLRDLSPSIPTPLLSAHIALVTPARRAVAMFNGVGVM